MPTTDAESVCRKILVALDVPSMDEALKLLDLLDGTDVGFKVGFQLFTVAGPRIIKEIKGRGKRLFLDLKFHDIPNTVARACEAATALGVDLLNLHVSGGTEMMYTAAEAVKAKADELGIMKPALLGVTVLTSMDEAAFRQVFNSDNSLTDQVGSMALLAQSAGLDGVVASPQEIGLIRSLCGEKFTIVTPGVRPEWASSDDQKRTMTPAQAFSAGASYVVIGRPIRSSPDPAKALERILQEVG